MRDILLGYELGSGNPVSIPVRHLCVTGQTQESGKTTTLQALITRSERAALAFITKRGERSFETGRQILPYFEERADWEFIESVIEAIMRQRMKFERAWIVRACKGANTLAGVRANVANLMSKSKRSMDQDIYMLLGEYLDKVLPLIAKLPKASKIALQTGLNVMDLRSYPEELQMLIVASSFRWIHAQENEVISILPEAWKFAPQGRNTPVKVEVRKLAREGAGLKNYLWVDSQDIAGVDKEILRACPVWLIGVQRESNEIERSLASIPKGIKRPKEGDIPTLKLGQFFACWGEHVRKVYVMPEWMRQIEAIKIARGEIRVEDAAPPSRAEEEDRMDYFAERVLSGETFDEPDPAEMERCRRELYKTFNNKAAYEEDRIDYKAAYEEDRMDYKAAYEEAQETIEALGETILELRERLGQLERKSAKDNSLPVVAQPLPASTKSVNAPLPGEEVAMSLEVKRPVIDVTVRKYVIQADDQGTQGRIAILLSEGFIDQARRIQDFYPEFRARGWMKQTGAPTPLNLPLAKLTEMGFLRMVGSSTYQAVPGMKVNVKEVEAIA